MNIRVLFQYMPQTNYVKGSVTIETKSHINLFKICINFFVTCYFFHPFCDWTELGKNPGKIMCLSIVSGIKKPVRIK